ncbi:type II toxin-antitoxin system RelB/DinJ family antitoxin [Mycoplasma mycoides subsp. capri]|uniref:type II toxin-antitoxin system RelB/DinJ family antitoxin n=1 Tax=Mycoplasma mycoides TaxID=2102 RepID=UPI00223E9680|nr:type II toxin-antitoxin system RelB/DinJ family antitoxin [Mycoplasma mycoides]UZK64136.1 type II toxin-antitoxin system RelB/DinJ family antitoxin [Mycoplasma mycoides subsp. capri]
MKTTNLNVRIDKEVKLDAEAIFNELGLSTSAAINMFFKATIRNNSLPFSTKLDTPNKETLLAMKEAEELLKDPNTKYYSSFKELLETLDD